MPSKTSKHRAYDDGYRLQTLMGQERWYIGDVAGLREVLRQWAEFCQ